MGFPADKKVLINAFDGGMTISSSSLLSPLEVRYFVEETHTINDYLFSLAGFRARKYDRQGPHSNPPSIHLNEKTYDELLVNTPTPSEYWTHHNVESSLTHSLCEFLFSPTIERGEG
ncbi:hypothetical protein NECAME_09878 [Necator americanus]|uniref:Uncharacterized protein n=1 Tax=Necator americanus TaxID=51031 RepID=W2TBD9_NECAM|nr:hypothetical protein NECAME_09878 [Necator americanus]ETN79345.1 hypothetical protein NECAME_09878 [Necator americanus]